METRFRAMRAEELETVSGVLARAFAEYAWTRWVIPEEGYEDRLRELQRLYLGHARECGSVVVDEGLRSVAALLPASAPEPGPELVARVVELHGDRIERLAQASETGQREPGEEVAPPAQWRLETIAVDPDAQGSGLGSGILRHALDGVRSHYPRAAISLETSAEDNVRFYERAGFRVVAEWQIAGGPRVWSMRSEPAGPAGAPD